MRKGRPDRVRTFTRRLALSAAVCTAALQPALSQQPAPAKAEVMPYDTYCQQDPAEKRRLFKETTPGHRATIMRTHLERWRDANRARLSAEQLALLKEMIAAMTPPAFGGGTSAEQAEAAKLIEDFEARGKTAFSSDDRRALRRDAPCVPKAK